VTEPEHETCGMTWAIWAFWGTVGVLALTGAVILGSVL